MFKHQKLCKYSFCAILAKMGRWSEKGINEQAAIRMVFTKCLVCPKSIKTRHLVVIECGLVVFFSVLIVLYNKIVSPLTCCDKQVFLLA
jgi:hypothetical protein